MNICGSIPARPRDVVFYIPISGAGNLGVSPLCLTGNLGVALVGFLAVAVGRQTDGLDGIVKLQVRGQLQQRDVIQEASVGVAGEVLVDDDLFSHDDLSGAAGEVGHAVPDRGRGARGL